MGQNHTLALLAYDGVQVLDITGPAAVFAAANDACGRQHYDVHILSPAGGPVRSNSAVSIATEALSALSPDAVDTWLVAGGEASAVRGLVRSDAARRWMEQASRHAKRYGSVCTGAFVLAHFGLLAGRRVATHWQSCADLARYYPELDVDANALYVEDGQVWTSAGVTTGIDMSLAIVASDLGNGVANAIAKRLVLYARRPGYQSQFSPVLSAQVRAGEPFADLISWMKQNLARKLDVPVLAERASMSDRSFYRKFTAEVGETPAAFVETLRLDEARNLLASGIAVKEIAARTGFSGSTQFSRAFERRFGMTPMLYREVHGSM